MLSRGDYTTADGWAVDLPFRRSFHVFRAAQIKDVSRSREQIQSFYPETMILFYKRTDAATRVGLGDRLSAMRKFRLLLTLTLWTLATQACAEDRVIAGWDTVSRIFQKRCINCHSQFGAAKALRLDNYEGVTTGSADGAVVLSGNSSQSELVKRLQGESMPRMPFLSTPLPKNEIELIIRWIDAGLPTTSRSD